MIIPFLFFAIGASAVPEYIDLCVKVPRGTPTSVNFEFNFELFPGEGSLIPCGGGLTKGCLTGAGRKYPLLLINF